MSGHILILFVSVLVAVSAVLSALGFKGRVEVIGVDLGTTYSVAAVSEKGRVRVFEDPVRGKLTASTVAFLQDGGVLVGNQAKRHALKDPKNVIYDAKRFIGRKYDDPSVAEQAKKYAFAVVENTTTHDAAASPLEHGHHPHCPWFSLWRLLSSDSTCARRRARAALFWPPPLHQLQTRRSRRSKLSTSASARSRGTIFQRWTPAAS